MDKRELYWQSRLSRLERRIDCLEARLNARDINPNNFGDYYTVNEAAAALQVNRQTIIRRIESGRLDGKKIGKTWRIPKSEITGIFDE